MRNKGVEQTGDNVTFRVTRQRYELPTHCQIAVIQAHMYVYYDHVFFLETHLLFPYKKTVFP